MSTTTTFAGCTPCCGGSDTCCCCCTTDTNFTFNVPDLTNGICSDCDLYEGDFTITFNTDTGDITGSQLTCVAAECLWQSTASGQGCGGTGSVWGLCCDGTTVYLAPNADNSNLEVLYEASLSDIVCGGDTTFTLTSTPSGDCTGWPETLVLTGDGENCGVTVGCCENELPTTLYATVENVSNAECLDSVTMTLTWNSVVADHWTGSETVTCAIGDTQFSLSLHCDNITCDDFGLDVCCGDCAGGGTFPPNAGCSCDPALFEFTVTDNGTTDCFDGSATFTVTITETAP